MTFRFLLPLATVFLAGMLPAQPAPPAPAAGTPPPPPPARGPRGGFGGRLDGPLSERRLTQQLGLNAEQQNKVHTAIEESRVVQQGMAQKEGDARTRLATAVRAGNEAQIDSVSQELAQLHQQRTAAGAKAWAKVYAALTPDQKTRVEGELNRTLGVPGVRRLGPGGAGGQGPRRGPPTPPPPPQQQ
jgi:Spy/CpxP family protein refolding chaperone